MENIIESIRSAFASRDFAPLVALFAEEGIYETPYAEAPNCWQGIDAIRDRFSRVSESAWNKAVMIENVTVRSTPADNASAVFVEFFISGVRKADGARFDFPSSVALIRVQDGRITHYQDYPNVSGIRKAAGLESAQ